MIEENNSPLSSELQRFIFFLSDGCSVRLLEAFASRQHQISFVASKFFQIIFSLQKLLHCKNLSHENVKALNNLYLSYQDSKIALLFPLFLTLSLNVEESVEQALNCIEKWGRALQAASNTAGVYNQSYYQDSIACLLTMVDIKSDNLKDSVLKSVALRLHTLMNLLQDSLEQQMTSVFAALYKSHQCDRQTVTHYLKSTGQFCYLVKYLQHTFPLHNESVQKHHNKENLLQEFEKQIGLHWFKYFQQQIALFHLHPFIEDAAFGRVQNIKQYTKVALSAFALQIGMEGRTKEEQKLFHCNWLEAFPHPSWLIDYYMKYKAYPELQKTLQLFMQTAIKGERELECMRYESKENVLHFAPLQQNRPDLLAQWRGVSRIEVDAIEGLPGLYAEKSDRFYDLMTVGELAKGSCQAIYSNGTNNQGLLGYVLSDKTQVLILRAPNHPFLARAMVRLLALESREQPLEPALFLEQVYAGKELDRIKGKTLIFLDLHRALIAAATQIAKQLQVPLITYKNQLKLMPSIEICSTVLDSETYVLRAYGGVVPEYLDANRKLEKEKADYSITRKDIVLIPFDSL